MLYRSREEEVPDEVGLRRKEASVLRETAAFVRFFFGAVKPSPSAMARLPSRPTLRSSLPHPPPWHHIPRHSQTSEMDPLGAPRCVPVP